MSSFFYFIKESLKGFTRNLSTALGSIVTIFLSLLIIGVFLVGGFVVEQCVSIPSDGDDDGSAGPSGRAPEGPGAPA